MSSGSGSNVPVSGASYWEGEELELGRRYNYRPEVIPLLLQQLGAVQVESVLDVGCGTGYLARLLAAHLPDALVTGLDNDSHLLQIARQLVEREGLQERVEILEGSAYQLPFEEESFDLVSSHTLLCILGNPDEALREQIRVTRRGGTVSAVTCFCRTDGLPRYHGRTGLAGDHRIDLLNYRLWQVWRQTIRPRQLQIDHTVVNQEVAWLFRAAGLENVEVNGHLSLVAPGDDRLPLEEAAAYATAVQEKDLLILEKQRREHGEELDAHGFSTTEFDELLELKRARLDYLREEPARVREAMEVITQPYIIVRGTRPLNPSGTL